MERKHDQDKKEVENKEIAIYKRPPELWNHPDVEIEDEKEHKFRYYKINFLLISFMLK